MGQTTSSDVQDTVCSFLSQLLMDDNTSLLSSEIHSLTYDDFLRAMSELNTLSKEYLDSNGKQLVFAVRKGTDSSLVWKATVQIACVKIDPKTQKVESYRMMNLPEFLKVFNTLKCQYSAVEQSTSSGNSSSNLEKMSPLTASALFNGLHGIAEKSVDSIESTSSECCICLERKPDILLPCTHSYCTPCIEEWKELNDTCPICRDRLEGTDDSWILSEVPNAEEIGQEIRANLSELTKERSPPCSPL